MGNTRINKQASVGNRKRRVGFQLSREFSCTWIRCSFRNKSHTNHRNPNNFLKYLFPIGLLFTSPVYASNTISSPSASSSGTVINNGYQTINGNFPTHRFSNGIQCQLPTLAITPFVTKGENFSLPRSTVSRTNIYDSAKDSDTGQLLNPGNILYVAEQERLDQTVYNLNYGITASFQIPLGGGGFNKECLQAAQTYRRYQEFMLDAKKLEVNLNRLKICAEQLKLGVKYVGEDAVSCRNVVLTTVPNQVIPHTHKLKQ
jgi:hypothetical protein